MVSRDPELRIFVPAHLVNGDLGARVAAFAAHFGSLDVVLLDGGLAAPVLPPAAAAAPGTWLPAARGGGAARAGAGEAAPALGAPAPRCGGAEGFGGTVRQAGEAAGGGSGDLALFPPAWGLQIVSQSGGYGAGGFASQGHGGGCGEFFGGAGYRYEHYLSTGAQEEASQTHVERLQAHPQAHDGGHAHWSGAGQDGNRSFGDGVVASFAACSGHAAVTSDSASRNEDPTDATSEVKTFYIGDGSVPDAGGEGAAPDMSALSGGVTFDGSGTSAVCGGASESPFGVGTSAQSGGVLDMSAHSGGVHHEWDAISSSSSVPSLAAGATEVAPMRKKKNRRKKNKKKVSSHVTEPGPEQLQVSGAPPDAMPSIFEASLEDLATDIQSGVFSQDAKELDDTDVALLGRFVDGEAVLSELQQQPSLRAPALEVASRLMAAGANSNVAFLPIVQGLATQQT
ncbi:unnamed protein product [Prorocentrum cordatum]|uniref:Uncharacterized protein n=1 Tax=Prorocentrum cordatum TaxID=2364126 RepID=A0ABN9XKT4_9DINO|nr:unnamed protein product [Polarella glacialis]